MSTVDPTSARVARRPSHLLIWGMFGLLAVLVMLSPIILRAASRLPLPGRYNGIVMQSPEPAADFQLTTQNGQRLALSDLRGKVVLLYFGYTFCPDACPTTLSELKKTRAALGAVADQVQVVMVTVDPTRDTPQALGDYLSYFDPTFIGLTGTEDELLAAATPYGVYFAKHEGTSESGYLVDHTTSVMAIDEDGFLRLLFPYGTSGEAIAADLRRLMK